MSKYLISMVLFLLLAGPGGCAAAAPVETGSVWRMVYYRILPGKDADFWGDFQATFKQVSARSIEKGLLKSYRLLENPYRNSSDDWSVLLMMEYENHAALDRFYREADQVYLEIFKTPERVAEISAPRYDYMEVYRVDLVTEKHL